MKKNIIIIILSFVTLQTKAMICCYDDELLKGTIDMLPNQFVVAPECGIVLSEKMLDYDPIGLVSTTANCKINVKMYKIIKNLRLDVMRRFCHVIIRDDTNICFILRDAYHKIDFCMERKGEIDVTFKHTSECRLISFSTIIEGYKYDCAAKFANHLFVAFRVTVTQCTAAPIE